ncbi:D-alanyl-D-alanine carboxypeptidase/D-alanyl-D-alanine-endopeptidase [Thiotrichales bacterium 19S9-12]|nr:D-alanyl-D-alanine carboxypeptidase/D-alanyl-D-alanine-endopeptidase [Thiotrichales bacterium 19S9-11]MCF6810868.1 D-alanyl-D-alanine carboxypeptidase/D-alanyl-D-alanine-endopeptidase [Thiotrichales bacterium 19S9-12]
MRYKRLGILSFVAIILYMQASLSFAVSSSFLNNKIQAEVKKLNLENIHLGIAVERTRSGDMLYQYQGDQSFIPASNNKIFTAIATLFSLPTDYRYKTQIYLDKRKIKNNQYQGDVYIQFSGDPQLTSSRLISLISRLKNLGIQTVKGNVYLVANDFSGPYYPIGWGYTDMNYCYAPPVSTLNLNRNCFVVNLVKNGKQTSVKRITNTQFMNIDNQTWLANYSELKKCQFNPVISFDNQVDLKGCLPDQKEWQFSFAVKNPALKMKESMPSFFKSAGLSLIGAVSFSNLPKGLDKVAEVQSDALKDLLERVLFHSDNLYAETLMRSVGLKLYGKGTVKSGTTAIRSVLKSKLKVDVDQLQLEDGSGLSVLDLTTPQFMVSVLTKAYYSPIGKEFYRLLPTSGKTGTIAYRMNQNGMLGRVHAKTGTLNGSSTLSGYILTKQTHRLSFSILINGLQESQRSKSRKLQDRIVKIFYQYL